MRETESDRLINLPKGFRVIEGIELARNWNGSTTLKRFLCKIYDVGLRAVPQQRIMMALLSELRLALLPSSHASQCDLCLCASPTLPRYMRFQSNSTGQCPNYAETTGRVSIRRLLPNCVGYPDSNLFCCCRASCRLGIRVAVTVEPTMGRLVDRQARNHWLD